jgi:hypothetical protein
LSLPTAGRYPEQSWILIYFRYRYLLSIAFLHAALSTTFYYGICGHDLAKEWGAAVGG